MEKAFKIFICVMAAVLIGWGVYSIINTKNKHEESIRMSNEVFARAWEKSNTTEELKQIVDHMEETIEKGKESNKEITELMTELNAALDNGNTEEAERLIDEIKKISTDE